MRDTSDYIFLPSFSLLPNQITSFNSVFIRNKKEGTIRSIHDVNNKYKNIIETDKKESTVKKQFHNYSISNNAYRNLKRKINWLYYLAKSKKIKTYSGKEIFNYKISFITLTLPSKQLTPTIEVTKQLLNPFLTEIKQRTNMDNYVWRLEFQKNGNVHYHLVTDTYIDYYIIRKIWNRLLESKGYIKTYRNKMQKLSLSDYVKTYDENSKILYADIVKNYARNKRENWSNPPSVDVKSVISNKAIANYISKYFSKESNDNPICNDLDNEENSKSIRLWFCSRSLSKLKTVSDFCEAVPFDIFSIVSYCSDTKKIIGKYWTVILFELKNFSSSARKWIEMILKDYSKRMGYSPAT